MIHSCTLLLRRVAAPALMLLFSLVPAFAQLEQGRWLVGGGLGGAYISINDQQAWWNGQSFTTRYYSQAGINVGTNLGYFLTNKIVVGGSFNTGISATGEEYFRNPITYWNIGVGPYIRYYAIPLSSEVALFGGAYLGYSFSVSNLPNYTQPLTTHQFNPSLNFGGTWFLTKNIALEGYVSYDRRYSFFNERTYNYSIGNVMVQSSTFPAYSQNTGSLSFGVGFQMFLDKLF